MKKIITICLFLIILMLGMKVVNAKETTAFYDGNVKYLAGPMSAKQVEDTCDALFGSPDEPGNVAYYLQKALEVMKYLGIILCIVLTIVDFAKAIFSDDKDMLKSLTKKALTRLLYVVILFFLPTIVELIMSLVGAYGTCGIK